MKEFENKIYRRLLAPVLACLVLALAGCSQDATEAEAPSSPTGGTYLTIVTRGINTTDDTQYEDYVGKLRVIAFDTDGNAVDGMNFTIDNMEDFHALVDLIYKYADETTTRMPLSDWHETTDAKSVGFRARSVVGGYYMKLLEQTMLTDKQTN